MTSITNCTTLANQVSESGVERRRQPRVSPPDTHYFTLTSNNHFLVARLADYGPEGVGIEAFESLPLDSRVKISGLVRVDTGWMELSGSARVVHCRPQGMDLFHLGLAFEAAKWTPVSDPTSQGSRN